MPSPAANGNLPVGLHDDTHQSNHTSPRSATAEAIEEDGVKGYFDLRPNHSSPVSSRSNALSMVEHANTMAPAFAALQYLPVPLIVLSSQKTVILANEAMGRLLNIDLALDQNALEDGSSELLSVTDKLHGYNMGQLGIDLLQGGSPLMVSWEVCSKVPSSVALRPMVSVWACLHAIKKCFDSDNVSGISKRYYERFCDRKHDQRRRR
jgi:hypothetical protein